MMPDPKLVDALDSFVGDVAAMPVRRELIEAFIREHRLVQLPEEPSGWASCEAIRRLEKKGMTTMWISTRPHPSSEAGPDRPVYIIPGDPQDVEP